jgi:hypothetical protein
MTWQVRFKITEVDSGFARLFHFVTARNNYVAARVCFTTGLTEPGCLLAHQAIEAYVKSILRLVPERYYFARYDDPAQSTKTKVWGHNLRALVGIAVNVCPILDTIVANSEFCDFLDNLTDAHSRLRFAEAGFEIGGPVHKLLDNVVRILDTAYLEKLIKGQALLGVPVTLQQEFLRDNTTFPQAMISGEPWANYTLFPFKTS